MPPAFVRSINGHLGRITSGLANCAISPPPSAPAPERLDDREVSHLTERLLRTSDETEFNCLLAKLSRGNAAVFEHMLASLYQQRAAMNRSSAPIPSHHRQHLNQLRARL